MTKILSIFRIFQVYTDDDYTFLEDDTWSKIFDILWNFTIKVTSLTNRFWGFLTDEIYLPTIGTFTLLGVLGGGMIVTMIIAYLVKTFVPMT